MIDKTKLAERIRQIAGLSDDEKSSLLALLNEQKRYGLVWEDKEEEVEKQLQDELPVLIEVADKRLPVVDGAPNHVLIEGDNLHALTCLSYTHENKIDVIYIDPPYNTGNRDFVYNDHYIDSEDDYRHSKWLSFMSKRLRIARRLLSGKGVIFISIDDNEQAALKLLCDEVFGAENFVTSFPWHSRQSLQNDTDLSVNHEYIVCFAKKRRQNDRRLKPSNADRWYEAGGFVFYPIKVDNDKYSNPDNDPRGPWKADPMDAPHVRPNLTYPIVNPNTGDQHLPPRGRCWRISPEKFASALADNRILFGKNGTGRPQLKVFLYEQEQYGSIAHSWLDAEKYKTATHGSKELQDVFGGEKMFTSPKPTALIQELLKLTTLPGSEKTTILDFFAGSGTTLHAVMQQNAADGGQRQCILVTNNENGICENVTYERNRRVIQGYTNAKGDKVEGLANNNLRYYRTGYVPRERTQRNMRALVNASTDLLCIQNNLYTEQDFTIDGKKVRKDIARWFGGMLIIYREEFAEEIANEIAKMDLGGEKLKVYIFSPGRYAFDDTFEDVQDKVELVALPAAIYDAYKRVLPKRKEKTFEEESKEDIPTTLF